MTYNMKTANYIATGNPAEVELQMRLAQYQALIMEPHSQVASHGIEMNMRFHDKLKAVASGREIHDNTPIPAGGGNAGKHARYTTEQLEALEMLFSRCPKPTLKQRQQLLLDCPTLRSVDQYQIKVWFQNRRCREKQRKESSRLQVLNGQLNAMNSTLLDENSKLREQLAQLMHENNVLRHHLSINVNMNSAAANYNYNYVLSNCSSGTRCASLSPTASLPSPP